MNINYNILLNSITTKTFYSKLVNVFSMQGDEHIKNGKNMFICTYSTEHLAKKDKVRFYYALKGRDGKSGLVKNLRIEQLGRTVLLVPQRYQEDMEQFIRLWNLPYTLRKVTVDKDILRGGGK